MSTLVFYCLWPLYYLRTPFIIYNIIIYEHTLYIIYKHSAIYEHRSYVLQILSVIDHHALVIYEHFLFILSVPLS